MATLLQNLLFNLEAVDRSLLYTFPGGEPRIKPHNASLQQWYMKLTCRLAGTWQEELAGMPDIVVIMCRLFERGWR